MFGLNIGPCRSKPPWKRGSYSSFFCLFLASTSCGCVHLVLCWYHERRQYLFPTSSWLIFWLQWQRYVLCSPTFLSHRPRPRDALTERRSTYWKFGEMAPNWGVLWIRLFSLIILIQCHFINFCWGIFWNR